MFKIEWRRFVTYLSNDPRIAYVGDNKLVVILSYRITASHKCWELRLQQTADERALPE